MPRTYQFSRTAAVSAALYSAVAATSLHAQLLAFPEAEGFGRFATGARTNLSSATVYHVTNLNNSGAGSFRDAVSQPNRFVVFDVGGIINLSSVLTVAPNVTIAGQTAPGGISVYNNRVAFHGADNLIARHFAIRMGTAPGREDAASIVRGQNMMFDHMSITWGVDGTFDINPDSGQIIDNLTIQNSIIGQGLDNVGHSTGGLMTLGEGRRFSIIKSIFADNVTRNPKVRGENEFINNVVYGYETSGYIMGETSATSRANVIGNYFIEGPVDGSSPFASGTATFHIYAADNWVDTNRNGSLDGSLNTTYPGANVVASPHPFPSTASMTAQQAVAYVLQYTGNIVTPDAVDLRIRQEIASYGTLGGVIDRPSDLFSGWGTDPKYLNPRARLADTDNDGMPDNWESAKGYNPASDTDWKTTNPAGYTRLEEYLNELGASGVTRNGGSGAFTSPATWGGTPLTLADVGITNGNITHAAGNGFARRLALSGSLAVSGGTLDVVDLLLFTSGSINLTGGNTTLGRLNLASSGQTATLTLSPGATLHAATIASGGGTASFNFTGGTLRFTGTPDVKIPTTLAPAVTNTVDTTSYSGTFSGLISGSGSLTKTGNGTLTLTANNTYSGGTTLTGNLKLAHNNAAGTGPISITSTGGMVQLGNGVTASNNITTAYLFEVLDVPDASAAATFAGALTSSGSAQVRAQASGSGAWLNITGSISAPNGFYFKTGQLNLRGNGSITGNGGAIGRGGTLATTFLLRDNATFNIGPFSMGGGQSLPSASIQIIQNATLSTGPSNLDLLSTTSSTSTSELNLDGGTLITGGFTKSSTGPTQTSRIDFNGGTLRHGGSSANPTFLPNLPGLTATVQTGGAKIDTPAHSITIAQPLLHDATLGATPDGGLTKLGPGSLTLSGNNTYTGPTTLQQGTLTLLPNSFTPALNNTDLRAGTLIFDHTGQPSPLNSITTALLTGKITSTTAPPTQTLAYAVDPLTSTITLLLAKKGDANLDGQINHDDYTLLDRSLAMNLPTPLWTDGDFNYDRQITSADYLQLDTAFAQSQGASPAFLSLRESQFGPEYVQQLLTSIPEPSLALSSILYPLSSLLLPRRRPRRHRNVTF